MIVVIIASGLMLAVPATDAGSHGGATGIVKERMDTMERLDELMDRIFAMLHGELPYDSATVRRAAEEIRDSSGRALTTLFPEGSHGEPSEARPEIWRDFGTFSHFADRLRVAADFLSGVADYPGDGRTLPRKWEDVTMGPGMMGPGMMGPGMMGPGMMRGGASSAAGLVAAHCNACHQRFRAEE